MTKVRVTIDITYKGNGPDHTELLDTFQDSPMMEDLLCTDIWVGEEVLEHEVSVMDSPKK